MKPRVALRKALSDNNLLGKSLSGPSWSNWRTLLIASMGEPLTEDEQSIFTELTGRPQEPLTPAEEVAVVVGRRGGKTEAISTVAAYVAGCCDFTDVLVPGELGMVMIVAADVEQAGIALDRIEAKLRISPVMKQLIKARTQKQLRLTNGVVVEVKAPNFRRVRGQTLIAFLGDEVGHWAVDEGAANPDSEIIAAVRPALSTTRGPLFLISTPYSKRGELYGLWKRHYGPNGDPKIIVAQAPSRVMNPTLPESVVTRAMERDAASARAEYLAEFRSDVCAFIDSEIVLSCVMKNVRELLPARSVSYWAFADPSGGSSDSFSCAIGHHDGTRDVCIIDCLREYIPPFSPETVVCELAQLLKSYNISSVSGDRYGGQWPAEAFSRYGVSYELSALPKSGLYGALLPLLNSGRIDLLDNPRLVSQLTNLERRVARGGREQIDHPSGSGYHDDLANSVAGVASMTVSNSGASIELLQKCNGTFDAQLAAEEALQRLADSSLSQPLWGPNAPGAVSLGHGGYRAPTFAERAALGLDDLATQVNRGQPPKNVRPW